MNESLDILSGHDSHPANMAARGISDDEAARRRAVDGPNTLPAPTRRPAWRQLVAQLTHFFALMLWVAAGLAMLGGMPALGFAIVVIVVLNGLFAFAQEYRADRATQELLGLIPVRARLIRDGELQDSPAEALVRGDVVVLAAGDRVPADLRLLSSVGTALDESILTGESEAVHRQPGGIVYAGTFVLEGDAVAVVEEIGTGTRLGGMAALTEAANRPPSPLDIQLNRLVSVVGTVAVTVGFVLAAAALAMGMGLTSAFLFGVGVTVALVPEGLLPTVTLSLARGAQRMARDHALVRRLDAVETLGATTFICTDKTGTLTRNEMSVVEAWTPQGRVVLTGSGYEPAADVVGPGPARELLAAAAAGARACVTGRAAEREGSWVPQGDPMEVALDVMARRLGAGTGTEPDLRLAFTPERMNSAALAGRVVHVLGAPEVIMSHCLERGDELAESRTELYNMTGQGRRVMAVARKTLVASPQDVAELEREIASDLELMTLIGIEDPPRDGVPEAISACRRADIRVVMITGDNARTGAAIAREIGLLRDGGAVLEGADLPADDGALAAVLDQPNGAVVARVAPADKLRIARALRSHGHVVAMTGDGVNDAAALRGADVGVAMGHTGSDVARAAADLILLDDHFGTIIRAVELGRATFANVRRFLVFHLTDNVAELLPFVVWVASGGSIPLAITVLQVLALDIGTDMLPALGLGAEAPSRHTLDGPRRARSVVDRPLLRRAFLLLGPFEAISAMAAFIAVLVAGGWQLGAVPDDATLAVASGTAFAVIAVAQVTNAFACRSETRPAWRIDPRTNHLLLVAVVAESCLLVLFLAVPWFSNLLGGSWPEVGGWVMAGLAGVGLLLVDGVYKGIRRPSAGGGVRVRS